MKFPFDDIHCNYFWRQAVVKTIKPRTFIEFLQHIFILNRIVHIYCLRTKSTGENVDDKSSWVIQSKDGKYTAINLSLDLFMSFSVRFDSSLLFLTVLCSSLTFSSSWCSHQGCESTSFKLISFFPHDFWCRKNCVSQSVLSQFRYPT